MSETAPSSNSESDSAATVFGEYLDRLIAGETLDIRQIRAEQPDVSEELIEQLRTFLGLAEGDAESQSKAFGDYELIRVLGRGGMGIVYEAWQRSLERLVAVKVLPTAVVADPRSVVRFKREAQISAKLRHKNIVSVFEMGVQQETPYYAMELIDGTSLSQELTRLREAKQTTSDSTVRKEYFRQIAESFVGVANGLHHAHSNGITHRDVKPSNLVFDVAMASDELPNGELRILDFGLALSDEHQNVTQSGCLVGTVRYMSPEQAAMVNSKRIDHRTDVYSLGATLYEAATLTPPFEGHDVHDTLKKITTFDPTAPQRHNSRVPHDLETIILKCMRKRPEDRYQTAKAVAQDLERFATGDPIEARPQSNVERVSRFMERNWRTTLVSASFLLMATMLTWALLRSVPPDPTLVDLRYKQWIRTAVAALRRTEPALYSQCPYKLFIYPWGYVRISPGDTEPIPYLARTCNPKPVKDAIAALDEAIKLDATRLDAFWYRARAYLLLGQEAQARKDLRAVLKIDSQFGPALHLLSSIMRVRGDDELESLVRQDRQAAKKTGWYQTWISAHEAFEGWSWALATERFKALASRKTEAEPYIGWQLEVRQGLLLSLLMQDVDLDQAIDAFAELTLLESEWPMLLDLQVTKGMLVLAMNRRGKAFGIFENLWNGADGPAKDHIVESLCVQHGLMIQAKRLDKTEDQELIEKWSSRINDPELSALVRYRMHWLQGDFEGGCDVLRQAIEDFPNNAWFPLALANGLWLKNGAFEYSKQAVDRDPTLTYALACYAFRAAHEYRKATQAEDAATMDVEEKRRAAEKAIATAASSPRQFAWEYVFLGLAYGMMGQVDEANEMFETVSSMDQNPWIAHNWGEMLRRAANGTSDESERLRLREQSLVKTDEAIAKNAQYNFVTEKISILLDLERLPDAIEAYLVLKMYKRPSSTEPRLAKALLARADAILQEEATAAEDSSLASINQVAAALQLLVDRNQLLGREQVGDFSATDILEKLVAVREHLDETRKAEREL